MTPRLWTIAAALSTLAALASSASLILQIINSRP
jgi:hypothetical protein